MATLIARLDPNMPRARDRILWLQVERRRSHTVLGFLHNAFDCTNTALWRGVHNPATNTDATLGRRNSCAYLGPQQVRGWAFARLAPRRGPPARREARSASWQRHVSRHPNARAVAGGAPAGRAG